MTPHFFRPTSTTPSWQKRQGGAVTCLLFSSHVGWLKARVVSEMAWQCLFCAGFSALLLSSLLTHYNSEHYRCHEERNFNIRCQIDGCTKTYSKVNSFTKHVRAVHRQFLSCTTNDTEGEPVLFEGVCT